MNMKNVAAAVALSLSVAAAPGLAGAADMVITSEIAATHWKARQMDALAADITKRTNGRLNAKVFHASTLYKDKDALAALSTGAVNMVWPVSNWLENVNPAYGVISLPFGVKDEMMQNGEFRSGLTTLMSSLVEDKGLQVLGIARTSEGIFLSKTPVATVADMKGKKVRVPSGRVLQNLMTRYGANPVAMATTEIATAFAQGAIDMVYTSPGGWEMVGTTAKHANIIPGMQISTYAVVVDKNWLAGLAKEDRDAVLAATADAMVKQWPEAMEEDIKALNNMVGKGGVSTRLSGAPVDEFEKLAAEVSAEFRKQYPDVSAKYDALVAKLPK